MTIQEFELEFQKKCRLESISIIKFEHVISAKLVKLDLQYRFDSIFIPAKFEIDMIYFTDKHVTGVIREENFPLFIETFYT